MNIGHRKIILGATLLATAYIGLSAQEASDSADFTAALADSLRDAASKMIALAEATPQEAYDYRPSPEVRTMSEIYMHVVGANLHTSAALGLAPPDGLDIPQGAFELRRQRRDWEQNLRTKQAVVPILKTSFDHALRAIEETEDLSRQISPFGFSASALDHLFLLLSHAHEHLGQAIAYARGAGLTPPWSQAPPQETPASSAILSAEGALGRMTGTDRFGNVETDLVAEDLTALGLEVGDRVDVTLCGTFLEDVFVAELVTDAESGAWFTLVTPRGTLVIGRSFASAMESLACEVQSAVLLHRP